MRDTEGILRHLEGLTLLSGTSQADRYEISYGVPHSSTFFQRFKSDQKMYLPSILGDFMGGSSVPGAGGSEYISESSGSGGLINVTS